jgi:hypothetical protein
LDLTLNSLAQLPDLSRDPGQNIVHRDNPGEVSILVDDREAPDTEIPHGRDGIIQTASYR